MQDLRASEIRRACVERVRELVRSSTGLQLQESEAVRLSCIAALREPVAAVGILFTRRIAQRFAPLLKRAAMTTTELRAFYPEAQSSPLWSTTFDNASASLSSSSKSRCLKHQQRTMEDSLKLTLVERAQKECWDSLATRCVSVLAFHFGDMEAALCVPLGSILKSDARRLDQSRARVDGFGMHSFIVLPIVDVLVETAVKGRA